ncbi:MAG: DNA mismatch repair protein MutT [Candidatus Levybacteria bacterium RIFOXYA1_FULL_41_10]|nr:MAG: hypothetical protein UT44_C0042G0017 [Candidatus Levybacteria bacterium GW2011_GWA1_39_32]KKR50227.1 MAG: hypothetical protein UT87_C0019G0010 [Candidatus Levybacteria bacterium GW2011_GWC1_40_19]KKR73199.1 MAG: hypothetical protein UU15_C0016G0003 [Candidatus Levybacteria bacterium GW2011_GWC2_40_7]KKR94495.1 MAG: hypothetical protein UU45_C0009G0004 [Candidatus Levybacteria bacterium GW2011_GWA2_41_15]KKS00192.1 MAG: hypothetical protein UU52_C0041G0003 [Candidatus Levybacteria bacter
MTIQRPEAGIGVIILKNKKVLLLKREGIAGDGTWCFPGGHIELNESFEEAAKRETIEESGIQIKNVSVVAVTNDILKTDNKHYVTVFVISDYDSGEEKLMEPNKSSEIKWFDWDRLPKPLFLPIENLLKQNFNPFSL